VVPWSIPVWTLTIILLFFSGVVAAQEGPIEPVSTPETILYLQGGETLGPTLTGQGGIFPPASPLRPTTFIVGEFEFLAEGNATIHDPGFAIYARTSSNELIPGRMASFEVALSLDGSEKARFTSTGRPLTNDFEGYNGRTTGTITIEAGQTLVAKVYITYTDMAPEVAWGRSNFMSRISFTGDTVRASNISTTWVHSGEALDELDEAKDRASGDGVVVDVRLDTLDPGLLRMATLGLEREGRGIKPVASWTGYDLDGDGAKTGYMGNGSFVIRWFIAGNDSILGGFVENGSVNATLQILTPSPSFWHFDLGRLDLSPPPEEQGFAPGVIVAVVVISVIPLVFLKVPAGVVLAPILALGGRFRRRGGRVVPDDVTANVNDDDDDELHGESSTAVITRNPYFRDFTFLLYSAFYVNVSMNVATNLLGVDIYQRSGSATLMAFHGAIMMFFMMGLGPVVWGYVSDRRSGRKGLMVSTNLAGLFLLIILSMTATQLVSVYVFTLAFMFFVGAKFLQFVLTTEYFPNKVRGTVLAYMTMAELFGAAVGNILAGFSYEMAGVGLTFAIALVFRALSLVFLFPVRDHGQVEEDGVTFRGLVYDSVAWVKGALRLETLRVGIAGFARMADPRRWFAGYSELPHRKQFDYLIAIGVIGGIGGNFIGILWGIYMIENGLPFRLFGIILAIGSLWTPIHIFLSGYLSDRIGPRKVYIWAQIIGYGLLWVLFNLFVQFGEKTVEGLFIVGMIFMIPVWPFIAITGQKMVSEMTSESIRGRALAILGIGGALGQLFGMTSGGFLKDWFGYEKTFLIAIIPVYISIVIAVYGIWFKRPEGTR